MKTLFITSFHPMISRNILASGVLDILKKENIRIVLIVPDYKKEYFEKTFRGGNLIVEGVPLYQASKKKVGLFFKKLGVFLFDTKSARLRKRYDYYCSRKITPFAVSMILGFIGHSLLLRRFVRILDLTFSPKGFFRPLLIKYQPSLVFTTDVQNENDVSLMQDANNLGIKTVSMVRSWDNLSLRFLRVFPDKLLVGSAELLEEAIDLHGYPKEKITLIGNPHYDKYISGPTKSREDFFAMFGLPLDKKCILYAPVSDALIRVNDIDAYVMRLLGALPVSVLVRFPPEKKVTLLDFSKPANMFYDKPGVSFKESTQGDREIRPEDDENLRNALYHADIVITGPTSICLDAALVDKPVIAVNFYPKEKHFFETVWRYSDNHIQKMLATGGVFYADSKEKFSAAISEYLKNPSKDKEGRAQVRSLWFSHADGKAAARLAAELLSLVS